MTNKNLFHPKTARAIEAYLKKPTHAVLVTGIQGSGKTFTSHYLASKLLKNGGDLQKSPQFKEVTKPDGKQEIPIDFIRQVIKSLSLKSNGLKRIIFVKNVQFLSEEAQNAFLKVLEEPPEDTYFILSVESSSQILPTIASRAQQIGVLPVPKNQAIEQLKAGYKETDIEKAWNLSHGAVGLLISLLEDSSANKVKFAVDDAKRFLKMDRYERLIYLDQVAADKTKLNLFLNGLNRVLSALSTSTINTDKQTQTKRLIIARKLVSSALDSLSKNTSSRLVAMNLVLRLPL